MKEHIRSRNYINNVNNQKEAYFRGLEDNVERERAASGAGIPPVTRRRLVR